MRASIILLVPGAGIIYTLSFLFFVFRFSTGLGGGAEAIFFSVLSNATSSSGHPSSLATSMNDLLCLLINGQREPPTVRGYTQF